MAELFEFIGALDSLAPGAGWLFTGDTYQDLEWFDTNELSKPTEQELLDEIDRLSQLKIEIEQQILLSTQLKEAAKESALAKLALLGLTEEEAKAVIGIE